MLAGCLLVFAPLIDAAVKDGYSELELAQARIANTIFFGYLTLAIIVLVIVWWLSTRKNTGKGKKEKVVEKNKRKKRK